MDGNSRAIIPSIKTVLAAVTAACTIVCAASPALTQTGTIMIPIGKMTIAMAPADFDFARTGQGGPGKWVVADDATAIEHRAIEQSSTDRTDYRFPLAIYRPLSAKNVDVSVRFKAVAGTVDRAGGIAVRLIDSDNYYVVRANALEDNVRFYRVIKGNRIEIKGANTKVSANEWHTLRLKAEGEHFSITFDGKELYTATDNAIAGVGRVGLWTKADSVTRFDRIEITTLP